MQINSQWLRRFNLAPDDLLDPCTNLRLGSQILSTDYRVALSRHHAQGPALVEALSRYNTGDAVRGVHNGYGGKVAGKVGLPFASRHAGPEPKAQTSLTPEVHPRAAQTGFAGTGPNVAKHIPGTPPSDASTPSGGLEEPTGGLADR